MAGELLPPHGHISSVVRGQRRQPAGAKDNVVAVVVVVFINDNVHTQLAQVCTAEAVTGRHAGAG